MTEQDTTTGEGGEEQPTPKKVYYKKWIGRLSVESKRDEEQGESKQNSRKKESQESCSPGICFGRTWFFGFGGLIAVVGVVLCVIWPIITSSILDKTLSLSEGSYMYEKWVETPIPMYQKFYLFNWSNIEETLHRGAKPVFTEMGPYVFSLKYRKKNLTWNKNYTVTYFNQREYHYEAELSNGSLTDKITNMNVVAMTVGWYLRDFPWFLKMIVNEFLMITEHTLVKTDTAINLLLAGSEDPLLKLANIASKVIKQLDILKKFAFFYEKNMTLTADGVFTMGTGKDDVNKVGLQTDWDYKDQTVFPGECGRVHGSFGDEFPPNSTDENQIFIFANDLCSVLPLTREATSSLLDVPTVTFVGTNDTFSNASSCYCTDGGCPASGARDVSACQGAPILMSWPHFYLADPSYGHNVGGMRPDPDKHQFIMELSKVTAVPMKVRARIQINLKIQSILDMNLFKHLPNITIPMVWFSQEADMTSDIASELFWAEKAVDWGRWAALIVGGVGVLHVAVGMALEVGGCFRRKKVETR